MQKTSPRLIQNPWGNDTPEKLRENGKKVHRWQDQIRGLFNPTDQIKGLVSPTHFADQIFGTNTAAENGRNISREQEPRRKQETVVFSHKTTEAEHRLQKETQAILEQLKKKVTVLEKSEKALAKDISKIKIDQVPPKTMGIYFLRYLEWLLSEVHKMRIKADEGRAWLQTFMAKKKKKIGYWKMYKKHGTTFGLSHERTLATQTG